MGQRDKQVLGMHCLLPAKLDQSLELIVLRPKAAHSWADNQGRDTSIGLCFWFCRGGNHWNVAWEK